MIEKHDTGKTPSSAKSNLLNSRIGKYISTVIQHKTKNGLFRDLYKIGNSSRTFDEIDSITWW